MGARSQEARNRRWLASIWLTALVAGVLALGCGRGPRDVRLGWRQQEVATLSQEAREKVRHGEVAVGMTREEVYLAMGVPQEIERTSTEKETRELWRYGNECHGRGEIQFQKGRVIAIRWANEGAARESVPGR